MQDDWSRDREQLYQALSEHSPVGIWQISIPEARTIYMNPAMRRLLEVENTVDASTLSYRDFFSPEAQRRVADEVARRAQGIAGNYPVEMIGRRGTRRRGVVSGAPMASPDGVIRTSIAIFTDLTDLRKTEAELHDRENRLRVMTEQVPAVLWTTDAQLRFNSGTGAGMKALGVTHEFYQGLHVTDVFEGEAKRTSPTVIAHKRAILGESVAYDQHFGGRWYRSHVEPLRGDSGEIVGVIGIGLDITDRKQAEDDLREAHDSLETRVEQRTQALLRANDALRIEIQERKVVEEDLRQSQARYASILNSQQTLVSRSDTLGRITYVNAAHKQVFGSVVGDSVFVKVHPEDVEPTTAAMEALQHPPFHCTLEQRCEVDGQWRTFLWQVGVIRDRSGRIIEYQGVGFDITERRRAEERVRESERRAREAAEFNRRLVQEVDHRVRNNLAGLLSLISAMRDSNNSARPDAPAADATVRDDNAFATAIEGRLLAMAQVHQLLAETNWRSVDLKTLIVSLLAEVERLCAFRTSVQVDGQPVRVAPRQVTPLSLIMLEWFTNSCKYGAHSTKLGHVQVRWTVEGSASTPRVRLRWTEAGGPSLKGPCKPSLGTELVQNFATRELRGACHLHFPETGADHVLEFPIQ